MKLKDLINILKKLNNKSYKAYKVLKNKEFNVDGCILKFEKIQGDPFASPSILSLRKNNFFPFDFLKTRRRKIFLEDFINRKLYSTLKKITKKRGTGHSGKFFIPKPQQEILERTSVKINEDSITIRFFAGLPAQGRRILAFEAIEMLTKGISIIIKEVLSKSSYKDSDLKNLITFADDIEFLRNKIKDLNLVSFIADGSILPRKSGVDPKPMSKSQAVPFKSPETLRYTILLPSGRKISGMGIPKGITLITGGGYHGKTTLLEAVQLGVYDHIIGDGREFVITDTSAFKIRSEDGRRISGVDISSFITSLPFGKRTDHFYTDDASGSTSMAANIMEALEAGAKVLLIDEDTSATNFMIRDVRMQELIPRDIEPIIPLIDRAREMYKSFDISFIIVVGGSGDYLDIADNVILMKNYIPIDATTKAKEIAKKFHNSRKKDVPFSFKFPKDRIPDKGSFDPSKGKKEEYIRVLDKRKMKFGREEIDLYALENITEEQQLWGIGYAMLYLLRNNIINGKNSMKYVINHIEDLIKKKGIDFLFEKTTPPNVAEFRSLELAGVINRLRTLEVFEK